MGGRKITSHQNGFYADFQSYYHHSEFIFQVKMPFWGSQLVGGVNHAQIVLIIGRKKLCLQSPLEVC